MKINQKAIMKFKFSSHFIHYLAQARNEVFKHGGFLIIAGIALLASCTSSPANDTWLLNCPKDDSSSCGYVNEAGEIMIDHGKYLMCISDTFDDYAIVLKEEDGFVAINKAEDVLYHVFIYDNGPDAPTEGLFRIIEDERIGYADVQTGEIKIKPQYVAARPFENNYAPICPDCEVVKDFDHSIWANGKWGLIDKNGTIVIQPQYDNIIEVSAKGEMLVEMEGEEKWVSLK